MNRREFERCTPESVGISSEAVNRYLDDLEKSYAEIHSVMIMRHDKIAAEGWWAPYAPGRKHMMMSASKTFTGTAVGIAAKEGILSLDEKIADLFPEYLPEHPSDNLLKVTVADLLCMGCGSDHEVPVDRNWPANFFRETEFAYEPGTQFLYNNAPATLLAYIIKKKTGQDLPEFLKERLFDIIGIDYDNVVWFKAPNGVNFATGGFHCCTEDLLRLMRLYLRNGNWDGVQILDEEYVRLATSKRIDSVNIFGYAKHDRFSDNVYGYGYMMWMSHDDMGYRAEGAYGQFGIVIPKLDMVIAITQSSTESPVSQTTLDDTWKFVQTIAGETLPEDPEACARLENRLERLAIRREPVSFGTCFTEATPLYLIDGQGNAPYVLFYDPIRAAYETDSMNGLTEFSFTPVPEKKLVSMHAVINGHTYELPVPVDGTRMHFELPEMIYTSSVLLSGYRKDKDTFAVRFRWAETGFVKELQFRFEGNTCRVSEEMITGADKDMRETVFTAVM